MGLGSFNRYRRDRGEWASVGLLVDKDNSVPETGEPAEDEDNVATKSAAETKLDLELGATLEEDEDLDDLTVAELREKASEMGLEGTSNMRKADLVDEIRSNS